LGRGLVPAGVRRRSRRRLRRPSRPHHPRRRCRTGRRRPPGRCPRRRLEKNRRKGIDDAAGNLRNKAPYLRYDTALEHGWPIATGIIEGACRHLVEDRLDLTGARWGLVGAEAVLKLRALCTNGDFNTYWTWHEQQEFTRNHQARYRDQLIPAV
jgi:hypothetical protein